MSQHTPGPWRVGELSPTLGYDCMFAGLRVGPVVLDGNDYGQKSCQDLRPDQAARMQADAQLIAAAPDMLAALQKIAAIGGADASGPTNIQYTAMGHLKCRHVASVAIAKATGAA